MMKANPLFDIDFLTQLTVKQQREIYARVTALSMDELPIEYIEGRVTAGTVNLDGASAVRRTCNLTIVAKDVDINAFYWGFKRKFILEVGVKNTINPKYPDIIWFNQGMFIITSFNTSQTTNNFTCTINGKDKMCLLNGDIAGHLPHSTDFGVEEYLDKVTNTITYTKIPIKQIIKNAVITFGNELAQNIIINDLDEIGLELLEYRGDSPMFMFKKEIEDEFTQMTFNANQTCYIDGDASKKTTISDSRIIYDNMVELGVDEKIPSIITFEPNGIRYHIVKFEYGQTSGYRLTDLTFAGDLIANVGETLTSVLDKIKNMLGDFEYFYNIDGKFVFQKKKNYLQTTWRLGENNPDVIVDNAINTSFPVFSFMNAELVTSFANNPNILNIRNDFSVWGTYKSISGADLPIHMRLALDAKPTSYFPIRSIWSRKVDSTAEPPKDYTYYYGLGMLTDRHYTDKDGIEMIGSYFNQPFTSDKWDWRELIYQMALDWRKHNNDDDFLLDIAAANPQCPTGKTGYEQYYIDLEGYWRQLYDPNPDMDTMDITYDEVSNILRNKGHILIKNPYRKYNEETDGGFTPEEIYILQDNIMYPLTKCGLIALTPGQTYYYKNSDGTFNAGTSDAQVLNEVSISLVYVKQGDNYVSFIEDKVKTIMESHKSSLYVKRNDYQDIHQIDQTIQHLYVESMDPIIYLRHNIYYAFDNFGTKLEAATEQKLDTNCYAEGFYTYDPQTHWSDTIYTAPETLLFWFDFLETEGGELAKYSVQAIGSRTKAINDSAVKTIYYRDIPSTIFQTQGDAEKYKDLPTGYTYINLPAEMESLFSISGRGKSAQEKMDELLQTHSYNVESSTIQTIPVYHLEPNTRVYVRDEASKIDGEYIVTKFAIPLTYNGTMSLTTNKVVANIM